VQTIAFLSWLKHANQNRESEAGDSLDKAVMVNDDEDDDDDSVAVVNGSDNGDGPHLVIAPASVLSNWAQRTTCCPGRRQERRTFDLAGREASHRKWGLNLSM
jgi:SNF2 family DNA or RNA helicase